MARDLKEAHVRFLNAESVDITSQWVSWSEYITFVENLISFSKLAKAAALRINVNLDGAPIASKSHTHPSHSQTDRLLTSSMSLGITVPHDT